MKSKSNGVEELSMIVGGEYITVSKDYINKGKTWRVDIYKAEYNSEMAFIPGELVDSYNGFISINNAISSIYDHRNIKELINITQENNKCNAKRKNNDNVTTICYGTRQKWSNREDAIAFFKEGIYSSDGAERERYVTIVLKLESGCKTASDR